MLFNSTDHIGASTSGALMQRMMNTAQQGIDSNARAMATVAGYQSMCAGLASSGAIEFNPASEYIDGNMLYTSNNIHANFCTPSYAYSGCNNCPTYLQCPLIKEGKGVGRTMHSLGMLSIAGRYGESIDSRISAINRWLGGLPYGSMPRIFSFERIENFFSGKPVYHLVFDLQNDRKKHLRSALEYTPPTPIGVCYEYTVLRMFDPIAYRSDQLNYTNDSNGKVPFYPVLDEAWVSQLIQDYHIHATDT